MRILMPVDGSTFSKAALSFLASRSTLIESQPDVELLNVQYPVSSRVARGAGKELVQQHQASEANKVIKPALATLKRAGLRAQVRTGVGSPGEEVGRIAAEDAADLIVMGSHGHTGFKNLLFGSVTQAVLASCNTPLLVLRSDAVPKKDSLKIGIALDGSKYGVAAVRFVVEHRALFGAAPSLTLIHVVPDLLNLVVPGFFAGTPVPGFQPERVAEMQSAAFERAMAPARKLLQGTVLDVTEAQLNSNDPGDAIATYASKKKLDILAIGSHGQGAFLSTTLGSVATRVAARCRNALLLIQQK
ncbi:MAG: universal stress protein [Rubrivivax sp.]|nr:universal stress protein [Rubrivivax sp.]